MKKKGGFVVNEVMPLGRNKEKMEVELEQALDLVGAGRYQVFHCALMLAILCAALLEMIGNAFILPAAACDLQLPDHLRGIITSIPNIGVILTAPFWGRAADALGRKPVLLISSAVAGAIALMAAFMPNLVSFVLCKLAASIFLSCPSSLGYAYAGELLPRRRRDIAVLACNGLLMLSSTLSPLLAWGVLSTDWRYQLGSLSLRPWRLLTALYATPLILTAVWLTKAKESPKYLMAKGKSEQALEVLRHIYAANTGLTPEDYCVTSLKQSSEESGRVMEKDESGRELTSKETNISTVALLKPPHLKWFALISFLMFGLFSLLNGLFLFAPTTINKVMSDGSSEEEGTICILMNQSENKTSTNTSACVDTISHDTFLIMVATTAAYGTAVMVISLCPVAKKTMLVSMFGLVGVACLLSGLLKNRMVAGVAMSALQLPALGIGPLTAYAVQLFPTSLRGTAVGAVMMFGRVGSVVGANAAGIFLAAACAATFYGFTVLLFLCAVLSLLLPKDRSPSLPSVSPSVNTLPSARTRDSSESDCR